MHQHILRILTVVEILNSSPFLMLKIKLWVNGIALFVALYTKKVTQILKTEGTLKPDNFVPLKSVIPLEI